MSHVLIEWSRSPDVRPSFYSTHQSRIRPQLDKGDLYERTVPLVVGRGTCPRAIVGSLASEGGARSSLQRALFFCSLNITRFVGVLRYGQGIRLTIVVIVIVDAMRASTVPRRRSCFRKVSVPPVAPGRWKTSDALNAPYIPVQPQNPRTDTDPQVPGPADYFRFASRRCKAAFQFTRAYCRANLRGWSTRVSKQSLDSIVQIVRNDASIDSVISKGVLPPNPHPSGGAKETTVRCVATLVEGHRINSITLILHQQLK